MRWRVGFRPTRPLWLAGIRIEPPPSLAWATGTIPAATAAAEPPLEPPVERSRSQGLRVGAVGAGLGRRQDPELRGVGLADRDEAGVAEALRRGRCRPAARKSASLSACMPRCRGCPAKAGAEVLEQERHALEGAVGQLARGLPRAPRS